MNDVTYYGNKELLKKNQGDRSLICSPKMRIEKRKSVSGFRFFVSKAVLSRQHCSCDTMGSGESVTVTKSDPV